MKTLEMMLSMLESDMAHVKEEYENFEDKNHPRYVYLKGEMFILNAYIHRVKHWIQNKS